MKKYIIINGTHIYFTEKETHEDAIIYAQNYMDQSKEIIVREITGIHDASHIYKKAII